LQRAHIICIQYVFGGMLKCSISYPVVMPLLWY